MSKLDTKIYFEHGVKWSYVDRNGTLHEKIKYYKPQRYVFYSLNTYFIYDFTEYVENENTGLQYKSFYYHGELQYSIDINAEELD